MQKFKFLIILSVIFLSGEIFAQDFEVAPVKMFFSVDPGDSETKVLTIKNHSNFKTSFNLTLSDFIIDDEGKKQVMNRNTTKNSCTEWITPEKNFFDINPNEQIQLKVTLSPAADDFSSRWAMLFVQTVSEQTSFEADVGVGAGLRLSGRIAVQIIRTPATEVKPNITIKHLKEEKQMQDDKNTESKERVFSAYIENEGTTITQCKVTFIASDLTYGEEFEFEPIIVDSYPGYPREVRFTLPDTMLPGKYSLVALLDYGVNTAIKGTRLNETLIIFDKEDKE